MVEEKVISEPLKFIIFAVVLVMFAVLINCGLMAALTAGALLGAIVLMVVAVSRATF